MNESTSDGIDQIAADRFKVVPHEELRVSNQEGLDEARCPLPLSVIPNNMGINLCNVKNVEWFTQDDGQLVSLTINFIPAE